MKMAISFLVWVAWLVWAGAWFLGMSHPPDWAWFSFIASITLQPFVSRRRKPEAVWALMSALPFLVGCLGLWWTQFAGPRWQVGALTALFWIGAISTVAYALYLERKAGANTREA